MKQKNSFLIFASWLVGYSMVFALGCTEHTVIVDDKKSDSLLLPVVITNEVSDITQSSAVCGGVISSDGGSAVTQRGVLFSLYPDFEPTGRLTTDGAGAGSFISQLTALTANTTYYVKAYAINVFGAGFGQVVSFNSAEDVFLFNPDVSYGTVTDIDGNTYRTVTIGNQTWMAENLKVTRYNDGTILPKVTDNSVWSMLRIGAWSEYANNPAYAASYGKLYNWYAVSSGKLSPAGWHVATDEEWNALSATLGGNAISGGKLKEPGTTHWFSPNAGANNESGFTALPGGYRDNIGIYYSLGLGSIWWTLNASELTTVKATYRTMVFDSRFLYKDSHEKMFGFSVRCVKD